MLKKIFRKNLKLFRNVFDESLEDKIELQGLAASWVDSSSRRIFPISFLIFNIVYWSFCLYHKYRQVTSNDLRCSREPVVMVISKKTFITQVRS